MTTASPAPSTPQEVIALHSSSAWVDKPGPGYNNGSMIRCACGWTADCAGHDGKTRRALWPQHVAEELAAIGVVPATDALRAAAGDLRAAETGVYAQLSGQAEDGWGHEAATVDDWYATWLEARAAGPGSSQQSKPLVAGPHPVQPQALGALARFLGMPTKAGA